MTTLAVGSSATIILRDGGSVAVATNGGFATVVVTPNGSSAVTTSVGPAPVRQVFGPYSEGGSVVLSNASCGALDYDSDRAAFSSADCAVLGIIGDSRAAQSYTTTGIAPTTVAKNAPNSPIGWACLLSAGRIRSGSAYNKAVSGSLVSDLSAQLAALLGSSARCTHLVILTGTNSFAAGVTGMQAWLQLVPNLIRAREAGMQPICIMDLPRAVSGWTAAAAQNSLWFNQLLRQNAPQLGAWVIDPSTYIADSASTSGDPIATYTYDGIHPATLGAYYVGKTLCDYVLSRLTIPVLPGFTNYADTYSATNNPLGSAISNGLFVGTSGTNTSSGGTASGTVATGWNNRTLTGTGTSAASLVARTDGKPGNWQQLVQTSGSGTSTYRFSQIANAALSTNYPASGSMVLECDVDVSSATGLETLGFTVSNFDGSSTYDSVLALGSSLISATYYPFPGAFAGRLRTEPLPYNVLANALLIRFETQVNTGAATIKLGCAELRPVS